MRPVKDGLVRAYCSIFARPTLYAFNRSLFSLALHGLGLLNSTDLKVSGEFAFLKRLLQQRLAPVVLDVGANRGAYSSLVKQLSPGATVYAFEPHPDTFAVLAQHAEAAGFTALNAACSDALGDALLYDLAEAKHGTSHATLNSATLESLYGLDAHSVSVDVITLDAFLQERGIERVDLLKIDTEGHDYRVLRGADHAIRDDRIDAIQFEFNEMNVVERIFLRDFRLLLAGYELYRILPSGLLPMNTMGVTESELFGFQNIVALREGMELGIG